VTTVSSQEQSHNRTLVTFFKVIIIAVLVLPWIVAGAIAFSFYQSVTDLNQELAYYQSGITALTSDKDVLQANLTSTQQELADTEQQLTEVTAEKKELQQTALALNEDGTIAEGYNGEAKGLSSPSGSQLEDLARDVIVGNWGNGRIRVIGLQEAGYNHSTIQQRVNEIIWGK